MGVDTALPDEPAASALDGSELLYAVQGGASVRTTAAAVAALAARPYTFGTAGVVATGRKAPTLRVEAAGTAYRLDVTASAGTLTAQVDASTDGGSTWAAVDSLALSSGLSATKSVDAALAAGTLLRVNYTAVSSASDPVVTLYVRRA